MRDSLKILNTKEKRSILSIIERQWGCRWETDLVFLKSRKNKIYLVTRDVERVLDHGLRIDSMGLYLGEVKGDEMRLSIEGSQLLGPQATRNVLQLTDEDFGRWMLGEDLMREHDERAFVLLSHNDDFCGCGRHKDGVIKNFVPKTRRVNELNI